MRSIAKSTSIASRISRERSWTRRPLSSTSRSTSECSSGWPSAYDPNRMIRSGRKRSAIWRTTPRMRILETMEARIIRVPGPTRLPPEGEPSPPERQVARKTGDYSVEGMESLLCLERKSLEDVVACMVTCRRPGRTPTRPAKGW